MLNETQISIEELVVGDFVVLGSRTTKVSAICEAALGGFEVTLADGTTKRFGENTKVTVFDNEDYDFEDYGARGRIDSRQF